MQELISRNKRIILFCADNNLKYPKKNIISITPFLLGGGANVNLYIIHASDVKHGV